jgi:D-xylose transport system substrate-binding protein
MRKRSLIAVAGLSVAALALTACGSSDDGDSAESPDSGGLEVGVLLPDSKSSARWENNDRPALEAAFEELGINAEIVNAEGSAQTQATQAEQFISDGAKVLLLVNLDSGSGASIIQKANDAGVKVIDYDRLTLGGGAEVYVSFDNTKVGELQGQGLIDCLEEKGAVKPLIATLNGSPTDNNATLFAAGYNSKLDPLYADGTFVKGPDQSVPQWDNQQAATIFEQMWTSTPNIAGVLAANDGLGNAAISVLEKNGAAGKVPVTGQDATVQGLQNILKGYQCMTVYKPIPVEANAAALAAAALLKGEEPDINGEVDDTETGKKVAAILNVPIAVNTANIQETVIKDAFVKVSELCAGDLAAACTAAGIS